MTRELSHHDEHLLYLRDKPAWARYVAPRRAAMLASAPSPEAKAGMWRGFGEASRAAIRALAEQQKREGA